MTLRRNRVIHQNSKSTVIAFCRMPITVYMHDKAAGGLIAIAKYGQEHGTEAPVQVLYHGYGHYDALQIPGEGGPRSRL